MKYIIYVIPLLFFINKSIGQEFKRPVDLKEQSEIFKNFTGFRERIKRIDNKVAWTYTLTGNEYDIQVQHLDNNDVIFGKKIISNIFAKDIKKHADTFIANTNNFPTPNGVACLTLKFNDTISFTNTKYYFPDHNETGYYYVEMVTYFKRDTTLENDIAYSMFYDGIYDSIFKSPGKNVINFAGNQIKIKAPFSWMGTNNIYCFEMGQMNWSVHESLDKAIKVRDIQMIVNQSTKKMDVIKIDTINVLFENREQKALRITYKANTPKIFWGKGSKILLVYYVISHRDNSFITTTLSHYEDQLINEDVPPPLNSIMSIKY